MHTSTAHERNYLKDLKAYHRLCRSICHTPSDLPLAQENTIDDLCSLIDKTEQIQIAFSNNLAIYLAETELVYDCFWRGGSNLKELNEVIWQHTENKYKNSSVPYQLIRLICFKIRHVKPIKIVLSDRYTLTNKSLAEFKETYSSLIEWYGWLLAIGQVFSVEPTLLETLQIKHRQAQATLMSALLNQETMWVSYQERMHSFDYLETKAKRIRVDFRRFYMVP